MSPECVYLHGCRKRICLRYTQYKYYLRRKPNSNWYNIFCVESNRYSYTGNRYSERCMVTSHNLPGYDTARQEFSWDDIYADADWDAPNDLNIGHEVADRHATDRGQVALYQVGTDGELSKMTFWELADRSSQFANVLTTSGLRRATGYSRICLESPSTTWRWSERSNTVRSGEASTSGSGPMASRTVWTTRREGRRHYD